MKNFNNKKKIITPLVFATMLSACGGGSEGSSPDKEVNNKPTLSLSSSNLTIEENTSTNVTINTTDQDGDNVSVSVKGSNSFVTYAYNEATKTLELNAREVTEDTEVVLTVTATDSKNLSVDKKLSLNITDVSNVVSNAPILELINGDKYQQLDKSTSRIAFSVEDSDTSFENLEFNVVAVYRGSEQEGNKPTLGLSVDKDTMEVVITSTDSTGLYNFDFDVELSVYDGVTIVSKTFFLRVLNEQIFPTIDLPLNLYLEENELITLPIRARSSVFPDRFEITNILYADSQNNELMPLNFSFDNNTKEISISPKTGSAYKSIRLIYQYKDDEFTVGFVQTINVKQQASELELDLFEKVTKLKETLLQSKEIDKVGDFVADYLYLTNYIDENGQLFDETQLKLTKREMFNLKHLKYTNALFYIANIESGLKTGNQYASQVFYDQAVANINGVTSNLSSGDNDLVLKVNDLLQSANINLTLSNEMMYQLANGSYSRFVGNSTYGSYIGNDWVFSPEYSILRAASALTLKDADL